MDNKYFKLGFASGAEMAYELESQIAHLKGDDARFFLLGFFERMGVAVIELGEASDEV